MTTETNGAGWATAAILVGRLVFAALFIMAVSFKLMDISATAGAIATAGFPPPTLLAWLAGGVEPALVAGFLPRADFFGAGLLAGGLLGVFAFWVHRMGGRRGGEKGRFWGGAGDFK